MACKDRQFVEQNAGISCVLKQLSDRRSVMAMSFQVVRSVLCGLVASVGFLSAGGHCEFAQAEENQQWLSWRGPNRDSKIDGQAWPSTLTEENFKKVWSVPFGDSYSGPIVTSNRCSPQKPFRVKNGSLVSIAKPARHVGARIGKGR